MANTFKQSADPLLDVIAMGEANRSSPHGEYGGMYAGIKNAPDVSTMTIREVKAFQKQQIAAGAKSSAAGRYQILHKSMDKYQKAANLTDDDIFSPENQNLMVKSLINKRAGDDPERIADVAAAEFASVKNKKGVGNYDGKLNKATIERSAILNAVKPQFGLVDVDYDPFAPAEQSGLVDVDYDPFAPQQQKQQEGGYSLSTGSMDNLKTNAADVGVGLLQGAADIGDTLINASTYLPRKIGDALTPQTMEGLILNTTPKSALTKWNEERSAGLEQFNQDNNNGMNIAGRIGGNILGTAGVGGVLARGLAVLDKAKFAKLAKSFESSGFAIGGAKAANKTETVINAGTRVAGAAGTGLAAGALVDPDSAIKSGAISAALPVVGKVAGTVGNAVGKAKKAVLGGASESLKQAKATQVQELQKAGYVLPPEDVDAGMASQVLNAVGGKIKTQQKASTLNQPVTNKAVAEDLGLNVDEPITRNALADVRKKAGEAYEVAKNYGKITADDVFKKDITKISEKYSSAGADFPELVGDDINNLINSLNKEAFESSSALSAIKVLREKADKAYRSGDTTLGKATKEASNALESMIERHLEISGASKKVIDNYRNARKTIAKTYTVDKALNETTGNVSAVKLGKQLEKGKPLEGKMKQAAEFGRYFPKAAQDVQGVNPYSVIDGAAIAGGLAFNPAVAAYAASRPIARGLVLNKTYQKAFVGNKGKTTFGKLLGSNKTKQIASKSTPALTASENR